MPIKTFFSIQELKLKDGNAPNLQVSQDEFDFEQMAKSHGDNVRYSKNEIYSKGTKWYMITIFERIVKENIKLQEIPFTKRKI